MTVENVRVRPGNGKSARRRTFADGANPSGLDRDVELSDQSLGRFGDEYVRYMQQVPAFIPRRRRGPAPSQGEVR